MNIICLTIGLSLVDIHLCHMAAKFVVSVDENYSYLPTLYWLPKLHKGYDPLINFPYTSIQRKDSFSSP